jgi:hypothetical protein
MSRRLSCTRIGGGLVSHVRLAHVDARRLHEVGSDLTELLVLQIRIPRLRREIAAIEHGEEIERRHALFVERLVPPVLRHAVVGPE